MNLGIAFALEARHALVAALTGKDEMRVAVDVPGRDQPALEIDDLIPAWCFRRSADPGDPSALEQRRPVGDQAIGHRALHHGGERSVLEEQGHFD